MCRTKERSGTVQTSKTDCTCTADSSQSTADLRRAGVLCGSALQTKEQVSGKSASDPKRSRNTRNVSLHSLTVPVNISGLACTITFRRGHCNAFRLSFYR